MKITHIMAEEGIYDYAGKEVRKCNVLTRFLHLTHEIINVLEIVSITFNETNVGIFTTNGIHHLVSNPSDIEELKKFFYMG